MTQPDSPDARNIEARISELRAIYCLECDNDAEGRCSTCGDMVCGSCFNNRHEYRPH